MKRLRAWLLGLLSLPLLALTAPDAVAAEASAWRGEPEGQVRLLNAGRRDGRLLLGLQFRLAPGWKTYWRAPGESGLPPRLDWEASENLASAEVMWPAPTRLSSFGFDSIGYTGDVVFPVSVTLKSPDAAATASLTLDYMVCKNICLPLNTVVTLALNAAGEGTAHGPLVRRYLAQVPVRQDNGPLGVVRAALLGAPGEQTLEVELTATAPLSAPDLFVEAPQPFRFGRPKVTLLDAGRRAIARLPVFAGRKHLDLAGRDIVLTVVDENRAIERRLRLSGGS